jgi:hypothetical protein
MLISDTHEFIFVHNYKVAGSSIKSALAPYATAPRPYAGWVRRQLDKIGLLEISDHPSHLKAKEIKKRGPARWEQYFTFGFIRNPWSWQVSLYAYMLENENHRQHELIHAMDSFDEYIEWRVSKAKVLQSEFFCDERGNVIVDAIGRLESIQDDFQAICDVLGIDATLPHENSSSHRDYREYYSDHSKKLIEEHFSEDVKRFGYAFEGTLSSPKRNAAASEVIDQNRRVESGA